MKIRVAITIDAPPAETWRTVEPIERHVDWMAEADAIRFIGPQTRGVGTTFDCLTKLGPFHLTDRMTVTEWEPPRVLGIRHEGLVSGPARWSLLPERGGAATRFVWVEDLRLRFPVKALGELGLLAYRPVLQLTFSLSMRNLARLASSGAR